MCFNFMNFYIWPHSLVIFVTGHVNATKTIFLSLVLYNRFIVSGRKLFSRKVKNDILKSFLSTVLSVLCNLRPLICKSD